MTTDSAKTLKEGSFVRESFVNEQVDASRTTVVVSPHVVFFRDDDYMVWLKVFNELLAFRIL